MTRATTSYERAADYAVVHAASPIADAARKVGAVRLADRMRPEIEHAVSTRDLRRAYGLGILSATTGLAPDVHQQESGLWADVEESEYLVRWIRAGVDATSWDTGRDAWAEGAPLVTPPATVDEYLLRLVCPDKAAFAAACVDALAAGEEMPTCDAKWCDQVRTRVQKHWRRGDRAATTSYDGGETF